MAAAEIRLVCQQPFVPLRSALLAECVLNDRKQDIVRVCVDGEND